MREMMTELTPLVMNKETLRNFCCCLSTLPLGIFLGWLLVRYGVHKKELDELAKRQKWRK